ncbi:sensor domain-containing diguanylate cyclase [Fervidibacillus albus]|uniref:Sensor domain-containing diguanylate cyclase n=1 Tax=Fervidibacillus albus TaxID=2980026 RepID=A0A9E8LV28_9BACI|nr:sensor domain-containing diguanylate cyclase [Fervidibacillus albus]WAA10240.1 sensor domain-containing diguanylate cyclase [Fervidibacillus albus]
MFVDKKRRIGIWVVWSFLFPLLVSYAYIITPNEGEWHWGDVFIFCLLFIGAAMIPIVVNNTPLSMTQWVTLATFLDFGLFTELVLSQIAVFVVLFRLKLPKEQWYRYPLNSTMFLLVSVISGQLYYLFGGNHDVYTINNSSFLSLAALYMLVYFLSNHWLLNFIYPIIYKTKRPIVSEDFLWELLLLIGIFPIGLILYFLYNTLGIISAFLIGLPVMSMLFVLNTYYRSQQMNQYLKKAVEFGHRLTEQLQENEVLDVFIQNVIRIFPIDYIYIFQDNRENQLHLTRKYGRGMDTTIDIVQDQNGFSSVDGLTKQARLYKEKREWRRTLDGYVPNDAESVLSVPAMNNNELIGLIIIASTKKREYEKFHLLIIEMLSSYLAIALENARHYEKTKHQSERCHLTHLYNARAFTETLEKEFHRLNGKKIRSLSLLIIDIDHFKHVNDTYGHQSGNEILCQLADLLRTLVGKIGFLARYGGEEFVVLLPNVDKEKANLLGERIRKTIENRTFVLFDDLSEVRRKLTVRITVSIGVASAPKDTDDPMTLLRYADRALYVGAKRVGRNKVSHYVG